MSSPTLTASAAQWLYIHGKAFYEGQDGFVTRQAFYEWDALGEFYLRVYDGLRLRHRIGARWDGTRKQFVRCTCDHCAKNPETVADVDIWDGESKTSIGEQKI